MVYTKPWQAGLCRAIAAVIVLIAVGACTKPQAAPDVPEVFVGDPKDGLSGPPEDKAGIFEDYTQILGFGEVPGSVILDEVLICSKASDCGGKTEVKFKIVPSNYVSDWGDALDSGNGHVVAKVIKTEDVPFGPFKMGKGDNVAYVWIGATKDDPSKGAGLYIIKKGEPKRIFKFKYIRYCNVANNGLPAVHSYRPHECTDTNPAPAAATLKKSSIEPISALASYFLRSLSASASQLDGLWFDCTSGCCEAQYDS